MDIARKKTLMRMAEKMSRHPTYSERLKIKDVSYIRDKASSKEN